jgi:hypothetical protein
MIILALLPEVTARLLKVTPGIIGDVKKYWPTKNPSGITTFGSPSSMRVCTSRSLPLVKNSRVVPGPPQLF